MDEKNILKEEDKQTIRKFISVPVFLFNESRVICLSPSSELLNIEMGTLQEFYREHHKKNRMDVPIVFILKNGESLKVQIAVKEVWYKQERYFLGEVYAVDESGDSIKSIKRTAYVQQLMLELSQKVTRLDEIDDIYQFVLEYCMRAVKKSMLCSLMVVEDGQTRVMAKAGYTDEICDFRMNVEDCFLYRETKGMMDRIANIRDLSIYYDRYFPKMIVGSEEYMLKSTISVPIYVNKQLFGMINFDALETNAFDHEDEELLSLVKHTLEAALSNHLLCQRLAEAASHDALTGLYNRISFEWQFDAIHDKDASLFIVVCDLNNLKPINDNLGHLCGDSILQEFAHKLSQFCREGEAVARSGGDEFEGILYGSSAKEIAGRLEKLHFSLLKHSVKCNGAQIPVSFSYGLAQYGRDGISLKELLIKADRRMYQYKKAYKEKNVE